MSSNGEKHGRSCPCKRLPMYLSSFTAAEHGNVQALNARISSSSGGSSIAARLDSAGNTPLHYAAQHGHVAVVSMLLQSADCDVNAAAGGATPLHRACYSGAVATIRLLLEDPSCDLLVQDTSFGDLQSPLHKACSGGRYLAVQLLLEALRGRRSTNDNDDDDNNNANLLDTALSIKDASGRTPLAVALEKQNNAVEESRNVVRWDTVAGGPPDWDKCIQLLECFQQNGEEKSSEAKRQKAVPENMASPSRSLPSHLQPPSNNNRKRRQQSLSQCMDVDCQAAEDGRCLTASWERAFQAALFNTVDQTIGGSSTARNEIAADDKSESAMETSSESSERTSEERQTDNVAVAESVDCSIDTRQDTTTPMSTETKTQAPPSATLGRFCDVCGCKSIALYPQDEVLVCKGCRRRPRTVVQQPAW